jgi:hypothetical protein
MEPLNDDQLRELLRQWEAPAAPATLEARVFGNRPSTSWWRWLLTGSIRIPVPVGAIVMAILIFLTFISMTGWKPAPAVTNPDNLAGFEPVKELKPRIIRSSYETR